MPHTAPSRSSNHAPRPETLRSTHPPPAAHAASERFEPPRVAKPIRSRGAWAFMIAIGALSAAFAFGIAAPAPWPSPMPLVATVVLAVLVAAVGRFGSFDTVDDLAEYASLAMPIAFAMLLVLDWRHYVAGLAFAETLTFAIEYLQRKNPTQWYIRVFNLCIFVVSGAAATGVLAAFGATEGRLSAAWSSPMPFVALLLAALVWKLGDTVQTAIFLALAAKTPLAEVRVPLRSFGAQFALFAIGIPFALVWRENAWLALFAIGPLGVGFRLLGVAELEYRVRTDARTGLTNAGAFDDRLGEALDDARRAGTPVALLYLDLDRFKAVNDTYGHLAGDEVLKQIGAELAAATRRNDVAARTGGEEFAMLVHDCGLGDALAFAERLRARIAERPFEIAGVPGVLAVTASFGVAVYPDHGGTPQALFDAADRALYGAKEAGRNRVCLADSSVVPLRRPTPER